MNIIFPLLLALASPQSSAESDANTAVKSAKMSKAQLRKQSKADAREMEFLQRSANLYWEGVRWNDSEKAANFIEDPGARLEFQAWLDDQGDERKITDVKIIRVNVQAVNAKDSPINRTAVIKVSAEGYTMPEQVLKKTIETQEWYRTSSGWWLRWTPPDSVPTP